MAASCDNLIKWLNTFDYPEPIKSVQELSNGVILSKILKDIAPETFNDEWASKIKADSSNNWRIKASNLKKVLKGILDFYSEELQLTISDSHMPDVTVIAEREDEREMGKLLQLLLGCAVNCAHKQEYIQRMMGLEETVQLAVMISIKELMITEMPQNSDPDLPQEMMSPAEYKKIVEEKEALGQRCHELDQQLLLLAEEKQALRTENERLNQRLNQVDILEDPSTPLGRRLQQLQRQVDQLQDELFKSETVKDDYRIKCEILVKDVQQLQIKNETLNKLTDESRNMKDELDILRHTSDKVVKYETTISNLKKKLEDFSDIKNQLKILEEKNMTYVERNLELEEELKKSLVYKSQLELYKRQVQDLQLNISEEAKNSDKHEFDLARCQEKIAGLQKEKERLVEERNSLKEMNEELKLMQSSQTASQVGIEGDGDGLELMSAPPHIRERLIKLQHELKILKLNTSQLTPEEVETFKNHLEDANTRKNELELELRSQNRKMLEMEAKIEDLTEANNQLTTNDTIPTFSSPPVPSMSSPSSISSTSLSSPLANMSLSSPSFPPVESVKTENAEDSKVEEVSELKKKLSEKDEEMESMELKYKLYLEKAKVLINHHQQRNVSPPDVSVLEERLAEKENYIKILENQLKASEAEEKLIMSAFYNLSTNLHKKNVEERLAKGLPAVPHSFLSRQRQVQSRRVSSGAQTPQHISR